MLVLSACGASADASPDATVETVDTSVEVEVVDDTNVVPEVEVVPEIEVVPACGPGSVPVLFECDDGDVCSDDVCVDGVCQNVAKVDCCRADSDCDDGVACTSDSCTTAHRCSSVRDDSFCCTKAADCEDNDVCTLGVCAANQCVYPIDPACEVPSVTHCNDQNSCTLEAWSDGHCHYEALVASGCCVADVDCVAAAGQVARCQESRCWFGPIGCTDAKDCAGPGFCSTGTCDDGECRYPESATCCETDAACSDGWDATLDHCVDHRCVNALAAQACTNDDGCVAPNACVATRCVSGQCDATLVDAVGCCSVDSDCSTTDRCSAVACVEGQCAASATTDPAAFVVEAFTTLDWTVEADGTGAAWRSTEAQFISAPAALFFGTEAGGYDVGATHGMVTSGPLTLPAGYASESLRVRFWRNLAVEPISSRDLVELHVLSDAGATRIWDKSFDAGPGIGWREDEVVLPAGLTGAVRLRLSFDSIDAVDNGRAGVFVDDLRVMAPCP